MKIPECDECGRPSVIHRRYEGTHLCKTHFLEDIEKKVRKHARVHGLVRHGDRILVAVSGGKDSLAQLVLLDRTRKKHGKIDLEALIIDEGIKGYREHGVEAARRACERLGVKLHVESFRDWFGATLDEMVARRRDPTVGACTFCGVFRRYIMNKKARELGMNKVAVGHNLDDEAQAILVNHIKGDLERGARLGPATPEPDNPLFVQRIKILRPIPERETALYALLCGIEPDMSECPYARESIRDRVRDFINQLEEEHPGTVFSIVRTFDRLLPILRREFLGKGRVWKCPECGEPTAVRGQPCKACQLKKLF